MFKQQNIIQPLKNFWTQVIQYCRRSTIGSILENQQVQWQVGMPSTHPVHQWSLAAAQDIPNHSENSVACTWNDKFA